MNVCYDVNVFTFNTRKTKETNNILTYCLISVSRSAKSPIPSRRIQNIIEYMTYEVFKYTVRGLYEIDKMTFTLLLALKIDMQACKIKHEEFSTFIKGEYFFT